MIEKYVPDCELDELVSKFSRTQVSKYKPAVTPIASNKLITVGSGKNASHMRLLAFNAPCLFGSSLPFRYERGAVTPENFDQVVYSGMNVVHALANMTIDSYCKAAQYGRLAKKNEKRAMEEFHAAFEKLASSKEYKPVVKAVQEFASQSELRLTEDDAEEIIVSYMTASDKALTLSNVSKGLFWSSVIASGLVGIGAAFFPPLYALLIPLYGASFAAAFSGVASHQHAMKAIEITKAVNFACVLSRFREFIVNRSDFVGDCNICVMLFDDMTDVSSVKTYAYVRTLADVLVKHTYQGGSCDFLKVEEVMNTSPFIKDYKGGKMISYYKDIFYRMEVASSCEDLKMIQDHVHGTPAPQYLLEDKPKDE